MIDSTWQYYYYRNHYFDNFNISDPRLLRTPFYEDKIMTYLTKVVPQIPDSLIPYADYFIEKSQSDSGLVPVYADYPLQLLWKKQYYGNGCRSGLYC